MPRPAGHFHLRKFFCVILLTKPQANLAEHTVGRPLMQYPDTSYSCAGEFIDSDHPAIIKFTETRADQSTATERAIALFYAVRDEIRYDPYSFSLERQALKASTTLINARGYCVPKAALLAACARAAGIPARIGFADVKNHLASERLLELMETNIFYYHGYTELWLDGAWRKATPAFNIELCEKFGVKPLDFDGHGDALMHEFDQSGRQHMQYLVDHGTHSDIPYAELSKAYLNHYPQMLAQSRPENGDMGAEIEAERNR